MGNMSMTIRTDEVAVSYAPQLLAWRVSQRLRQIDVAEKFGVSQMAISRMERNPANVAVYIYNKIAEKMGWPQFVPNRKKIASTPNINTPTQYQPQPQRQKEPTKGNTRQMRIDFDSALSSAERLSSWLDLQGEELKSHVNILASFYRTTPESVMKSALIAYIEPRLKIIAVQEQREKTDDELRGKLPQ